MKEVYSSEEFIANPCGGTFTQQNEGNPHVYIVQNRQTEEVVDFGTDQDSYLPERSNSHDLCPPCKAEMFKASSIYDPRLTRIMASALPAFEKFLIDRIVGALNDVATPSNSQA
jgi:hypothetical protein